MELTTEKVGECLVVHVSGELDLATAPEFRSRIDADLDRYRCRDLVVDFAEVGFVDSSGLGAVLGRFRRVKEMGGRLAVCRPVPHVHRLLELAGVLRLIRVYDTVQEALAALGSKPAVVGGDKH